MRVDFQRAGSSGIARFWGGRPRLAIHFQDTASAASQIHRHVLAEEMAGIFMQQL